MLGSRLMLTHLDGTLRYARLNTVNPGRPFQLLLGCVLRLMAESWRGYMLTPCFGPSAIAVILYLPLLACVLIPESTMRSNPELPGECGR